MNAVEMLPNIEAELLDKVCFFKASEHEISFAGCEAKITKELPHFLAHLRDYVIPETLKNPKSDRFGPAAYHHPELLAEAKGAAPSANFGEIVDQWRTHYFTFHDKKPEWSGTALELSQAMNEDGALTQILKQTVRSTYQFSRMLGQLATQGAEGIVKHKTSARWEYRILRPRPLAFPNP
jgi:hypothetical protein